MIETWRSGPAAVHRRITVVLIELVVLAVAWRLYRYGRFLVRDQRAAAFDNAHEVRWLERATGLDVELGIQRLATANHLVIEFLNRYYVYAHFPLTIGCLLWLMIRRPEVYRPLRRALFGAMAVGLVVHAVYPLAPPRMVRATGMTDTLAEFGPRVYSANHFASISNQFAAMPSFHAGWAVMVAWLVVRHGRHRLRWVSVAHPVLMIVAIMATANHYLLDALAGAALIFAAVVTEQWIREASVGRRQEVDVFGGLLERAVGAVGQPREEVDDATARVAIRRNADHDRSS